MKRAIPLSIVPIVIGIGACSSSSGNNAMTGNSSKDGGATIDGQASDGGAPDGSVSDGGAQADALNLADGTATDAASTDDGSEEAGDENDTTPYAATLTGAQVIPPLTTAGTGTAALTLLGDGVTLQYNVTLTGLSSTITGVNIHVGSAVDNTGISHQLPLPAGVGTSAMMTGSVALSSTEPNDEIDALPFGLYMDVFTQNNPGGELRGQIVPPGDTVWVAHLTPAQEVPPVQSAYSAAAAFILSADGTSIQYNLGVASSIPTQAIQGISYGAAIGGQPIIVGAMTGLMTGTSANIAVTSAASWINGDMFLNVETAAHPTGELRGQIVAPGETLFTSTLGRSAAALAGSSMTEGWAQVIVDPTGTSARYEIDTTTANLTAVALNVGGFPGATGGDAGAEASDAGVVRTYPLTIAGSGATDQDPNNGGTITPLALTADDVTQLKAGNAWISVATLSYAGGELQGALTAQ